MIRSPSQSWPNQHFSLIHHVDQATINSMYSEYPAVFVLTTGRTGSRLLVELLNLCKGINAFHEPSPTMQYFSNFAYHHQERHELLAKMLDAARMELVLQTLIRHQIYVEANQCLTFFAPAIAGLFRQARFVHLVRHPGDFVRSAWRKGWHRNDSIWESGRVRLENETTWKAMNEIEKLAWVWTATNQYIENFKASIQKERFHLVRLEDLAADKTATEKLAAFCGGGLPENKAAQALRERPVNPLHIGADEPPNMRKHADFPHYHDWSARQRQDLLRHADGLAKYYGYDLSRTDSDPKGKP